MYPETAVRLGVWKYVSPVLIIFGTFGNALSIYVLNRRHRTATSTSTYLTSLAVFDIIALVTGLLRQWIINMFNVDIRSMNDFLCKGHMFVVSLACQYSSWCLVIVTIERVLCVWKPHAVKVGCTKKLSHVIMLILFLALLLINFHFLLGFRLQISTSSLHDYSTSASNGSLAKTNSPHMREECTDSDDKEYVKFAHFVWPWIDACVLFVFPFFVLLLGNIVILRSIQRSRRFRREILASRQARITLNISTSQAPLLPLKTMLLVLNSIFFVTVGPITVFSIGQFYWWPNNVPEGRELEVAKLTWAIINILMYTNNAINFVLYILCGSEFRKEVKGLFSSCCHGYRTLSPTSSIPTNDSRIHRGRSSTDFTSSF